MFYSIIVFIYFLLLISKITFNWTRNNFTHKKNWKPKRNKRKFVQEKHEFSFLPYLIKISIDGSFYSFLFFKWCGYCCKGQWLPHHNRSYYKPRHPLSLSWFAFEAVPSKEKKKKDWKMMCASLPAKKKIQHGFVVVAVCYAVRVMMNHHYTQPSCCCKGKFKKDFVSIYGQKKI